MWMSWTCWKGKVQVENDDEWESENEGWKRTGIGMDDTEDW